MDFYKAHGLANDFLIIDDRAGLDYVRLAVEMCARHTGVGADGLLVIGGGNGADCSLRFFNSDGSEAEMSGNGIRCAAAVLYYSGRANSEELKISTVSGMKTIRLRARAGHRFDFQVVMGKPGFAPAEIPMAVSDAERIVQYPLDVEGERVLITAVSTGNPHCTVFVENFELDWRALGAKLERHPLFPKRTNVEFARIVSRTEIEARFWERGAGETQSSGTGSCGAAIASMINGYTDRSVTVHAPAGRLKIDWCEDATIALTGGAEVICKGRYLTTETQR